MTFGDSPRAYSLLPTILQSFVDALGKHPGTLVVVGDLNSKPTPAELSGQALAFPRIGDMVNRNLPDSPDGTLHEHLTDAAPSSWADDDITSPSSPCAQSAGCDNTCLDRRMLRVQEMTVEYHARGCGDCQNPLVHVQLLAEYGMDLISRDPLLQKMQAVVASHQQPRENTESSFDLAVLIQSWQLWYLYDPQQPVNWWPADLSNA